MADGNYIAKKEPGKRPRGQNLYIKEPGIEFTGRVKSWVDYLGISDLFPNIDELSGKILEVGDKLRDAGPDHSYLGMADGDLALIRPGDYAVFLHELTHNNPEFRNKLLSTEAGAFAIETFAAGDYDGALKVLFNSDVYDGMDKTRGRAIAEGSVVLGRNVFDILKRAGKNISTPELIKRLKTPAEDYEEGVSNSENEIMRYYKKSRGRMFSENVFPAMLYLVGCHRMTPFSARYLLEATGDDKDTIVKSTSKTKKDIMGSFKSLASFYHINLGYSLLEALEKTDEHFLNEEAETISRTLRYGAKDVFAKMKEYGYDMKTCMGISEAMISHGAAYSRELERGLPKFLELTGQYGPAGSDVMDLALRSPNFFAASVLTDLAGNLLSLSDDEPEQARMILAELGNCDWDSPPSINLRSNLHLHGLYGNQIDKPMLMKMSQREKAKLAAFSVYLTLVDTEYGSKRVGFSTSDYLSSNFNELLEKLGKRIGKNLPEITHHPNIFRKKDL